jgi:putative Holliday junction resolvase
VSILALDVGSKRIGVAVADPSRTFAMPVETIERTNLDADLARIMALVESYGVRDLVIGDPVTLAGERGLAALKMDAFVERLRGVFRGTIHRVDERLTTAQATKTLISADVSRKKRKGIVDRLAAALILESFLGRLRNERLP